MAILVARGLTRKRRTGIELPANTDTGTRSSRVSATQAPNLSWKHASLQSTAQPSR